MKTLKIEMDPETYAQCEKAAIAAGKKTVEEWLAFLITDRVGHTPFYPNR